jgi:hypothetical protein
MNSPQEIFLVDREHAGFTNGANGGGANLVFEDRHLTKEIVFAEFSEANLLAIMLRNHFDSSVLYDVHAFARLSLTDNQLAIPVYLAQIAHIRIILEELMILEVTEITY